MIELLHPNFSKAPSSLKKLHIYLTRKLSAAKIRFLPDEYSHHDRSLH